MGMGGGGAPINKQTHHRIIKCKPKLITSLNDVNLLIAWLYMRAEIP